MDMVPMTIDQELLRGLDWDRGVCIALIDGLEITGPDGTERAHRFLQEPPDVQSRREDLQKRLERLRKAKRDFLLLASSSSPLVDVSSTTHPSQDLLQSHEEQSSLGKEWREERDMSRALSIYGGDLDPTRPHRY